MPGKINTGKGGTKRTFRTTDKCVQAEMKNKVEVARFALQKRILDRQQSHSGFMVEKDKRSALAALSKMRTTSGLSMHGVAPDGPADRGHEDSPYFKMCRPLSEKRLLAWRSKEDALQRLLAVDEDFLIPPWERDPNDVMNEKFAKMMRMMGYEVEDDDVAKQMIQPDTMSDKSSVNGHIGEKVDPFECLKPIIQEEVDHASFDSLKPKAFSIKKKKVPTATLR